MRSDTGKQQSRRGTGGTRRNGEQQAHRPCETESLDDVTAKGAGVKRCFWLLGFLFLLYDWCKSPVLMRLSSEWPSKLVQIQSRGFSCRRGEV